MKKIIFLVILLAGLSASNCAAQAKTEKSEKLSACKHLTLSDAEKILGQAAKLVEAVTEVKNDSHSLKCTYTALSKDPASGRDISLYFMLEESPSDDAAKQIYEGIWQSNKNHAGIEKINGIGDEAYFHGERPNFHFAMVRKGKFTIRLKVNKAVETTSADEVKAFVKRLTSEI